MIMYMVFAYQFEFDKLQRMKHELQQSAQHCENHVSAEITVQHDGDVAMESTLAEFADNVNRALLEATNQVMLAHTHAHIYKKYI